MHDIKLSTADTVSGTLVEKPSASFTIKEAILKVLSESSRSMTAQEIYVQIINQGLYTFGAQNPVNVVRNTIESACSNSRYSEKYRDATPLFHFEEISHRKRVYSLLKERTLKAPVTQTALTVEFQILHRLDLSIWNRKVEQEFHKWLERENYAQRTADSYRRAVAQIFRSYPELAQKAVEISKTESEAVRNYKVLLQVDGGFVEENTARHSQFTAALAALERFHTTDIEIVESEDAEPTSNPPEPSNAFASSLGNIVDLEEGKAGIRETIEAHFQTLHGYSNLGILWHAAQDNLSLFLNDNAINTADVFWGIISHLFSGEYVMSNPHIWRIQPDYPQSYVGVVINLARQFGGIVTREQIDEYFSRIKQGAPFNSAIIRQGLLIFYLTRQFILTETISLTGERCSLITKSLDKLFEHENASYIVLRDITAEWFSSLPAIRGGLNWTTLLLQEVLRLRPDIGYRVVLSGLDGQTLDTLGAAIVPIRSDIDSFADIVHRYCYEREILDEKMPSEDLRGILRDAGMLGGNELIYNLHKALRDYRFAFTDEHKMVKILRVT